ncbi:UNVERIFIED_CONTAM: hypothetical protein K2H54_024519 [Gekko kuhli]
MIVPRGRWLYLFTLTCCLAVVLNSVGSEAQVEPRFPGEDAPLEELLRFYTEYQQYLNSINRPRFGKRSNKQTLCEDPYAC